MSRQLSRRRRMLFQAVYVGYVVILCWLGIKAFWMLRFGTVDASKPETEIIWHYFDPELSKSGATEVSANPQDDSYRVLLLGGSVLEQVAEHLEAELRQQVGDHVRVFNVSRSAHTSRDSRLKYSYLENRRFDLVVVYHGINDVRMNCCPEKAFRDDYRHCARYDALHKRLEAGKINLPMILLDQAEKISLGTPNPKDLEFGSRIKTAKAFRDNIAAIVQRANAQNQTVVLMSFAYHLPAGYTKTGFLDRELDYGAGRHRLDVETWGIPKHVVATIDVHNKAIRELAANAPNIIFVDQEKQLERSGRHFSDICHLTDAGCRAFVDNLMPSVNKSIEEANRNQSPN